MKNSLIILLFFVLGVGVGAWGEGGGWIPDAFDSLSTYVLYGLMGLVGFGIGGDTQALKVLKDTKLKIMLVPLSVVIGSLGGASLVYVFIKDLDLQEVLAISAGFGYYSLSSLFITELRGEVPGTIALLTNIMREIITLLMTPLFVRWAGPLGPIASGGATSMDTTLPIISLYSGKQYVMIALFSGIVLTVVVPFLVPFILSF
ncbi:lysine exporter LysO family protein [Oceanispirochaeta crateris]|uniref:Lysine exporter LysO family protein n=1 Tax=Oceanispirochaeta crateris TaxID=2518645 RepID=A0A5C1QRX6_9SPIO|nr:lysine exporter LysO family protein [Oceanispirochaeta crateris]QEN09730.1 lysine exporter LysO family protein [Oceanispirochaeta crateris]